MDCSIYVGKTKVLNSCAVTAQLIWPLFSHMCKAGFLMAWFVFEVIVLFSGFSFFKNSNEQAIWI